MKPMQPLRLLLAAAAIFAFASGSAWAQGKLEIEGGPTHDWGTVSPGELTTTIKVKNTGTDDLKITEVRPSCGCTAAPIDKNLLKPGEIGNISVKLDAKGRAGQLVKTITVNSSDSSNPSQMITLKANIKLAMTFEPAQYMLVNGAKVGTQTTSMVTITNTSDEAFTISPPQLAQGNVKAKFDMKKKKELKPGEKLELKVHITPQAAGPLNGIVRVETTAKDHAQVDFTIYGTAADAGTATGKVSESPSGTSHK